MTIVPLNLGASENDGSGQNLRSGGQVINANFAELDQRTTAAQASADAAAGAAANADSKADNAQAKADAAIPASQKGQPGGVAVLDGSGVVPASQLPSYVDDVLEFANLAAFPVTGETGKIYVAINTNSQYRWSGTQYILLSASPGSTDAVPEGAVNKYWTNARSIASVLTGLLTTNPAVVTAADTILTAVGKLQRQISDAVAALGNKAAKGANSDITSLSGLTTAVSIAQGGTGATTLAAAQAALGINSAINLPTGTDLNNIQATGPYMQQANVNATLALNYPVAKAGSLTVVHLASITTQFYLVYDSGDIYSRSRYSTTWYPWRKMSTAEFVSQQLADVNPVSLGTFSLTHDLGFVPQFVSYSYRCKVAELGYAVGDVVLPQDLKYDSASTFARGFLIKSLTSTTCSGINGSTGIVLLHNTTNVASTATIANWAIQITVGGIQP